MRNFRSDVEEGLTDYLGFSSGIMGFGKFTFENYFTDADTLCAGENASELRWSSHFLALYEYVSHSESL